MKKFNINIYESKSLNIWTKNKIFHAFVTSSITKFIIFGLYFQNSFFTIESNIAKHQLQNRIYRINRIMFNNNLLRIRIPINCGFS
jgi:hypothetical protein